MCFARLLINDFTAAAHIIPTLDAQAHTQIINGVSISPWPESPCEMPDFIIETFSCGVPEHYARVAASKQKSAKGLQWINLEYLSAEAWVADFHLQRSQHPTLGYQRTFYYPGFSTNTGGLLRERDLPSKQEIWQTQSEQQSFFPRHTALPFEAIRASINISLFCYPQAPVLAWVNALRDYAKPINLLVPCNEGSAIKQTLESELDFDQTGKALAGAVTVQCLPFLSQDAYDQLLSYCDLNFVRGEDSWIRAIWAGQPFIWQPYWQTDETHLHKLSAFLKTYAQSSKASHSLTNTVNTAHAAWSDTANTKINVPQVLEDLPEWKAFSAQSRAFFLQQTDLATQLIELLKPQAKTVA